MNICKKSGNVRRQGVQLNLWELYAVLFEKNSIFIKCYKCSSNFRDNNDDKKKKLECYNCDYTTTLNELFNRYSNNPEFEKVVKKHINKCNYRLL